MPITALAGEDGEGTSEEDGSETTAVELQYLSAKFPGNDISGTWTVDGDLSEQNGLEDDYDGSSVTLLDALVKMHIEASRYDDREFDITNWLVPDDEGGFSLLFGRSDSTKLRCLVNDKVQTDWTGFVLEDGDIVEFFGELATSAMAKKVAEWLRNEVGMDTAGPDEASAIFGLARVKYMMTLDECRTYYANAVNEYLPILEENDGMLDKNGPGENARAALALFAIGAYYADIETLGLLPPFADFDWVTAQGAQDAALALLALDADKDGKGERFAVPLLAEDSKKTQTTREGLIGYLIGQQCKGGGWGWAPEEEINPVTTAVVLQALAPYRDDPGVLDAIDEALAALSKEQDSYSGSFGNTEANAQVIIALNTLGVSFDDPDAQDNMFVKNGETVMDALLYCYQDIDETMGAFFFTPPRGGKGGAAFDKVASIWGLNALESYDRVLTQRSVLYDLSDMGGKLNMPMPKPQDDDKDDGGNTGVQTGGGEGANAGQASVLTPAPAPLASPAARSAANADAGGQATVSPGLFGSPGAREPAADAAAGEENGSLASEGAQLGGSDMPLGDGDEDPVGAPGKGKTIAFIVGIAALIAAAAVGLLFKAGILALPPKA
jgi:hypothetical protein